MDSTKHECTPGDTASWAQHLHRLGLRKFTLLQKYVGLDSSYIGVRPIVNTGVSIHDIHIMGNTIFPRYNISNKWCCVKYRRCMIEYLQVDSS